MEQIELIKNQLKLRDYILKEKIYETNYYFLFRAKKSFLTKKKKNIENFRLIKIANPLFNYLIENVIYIYQII